MFHNSSWTLFLLTSVQYLSSKSQPVEAIRRTAVILTLSLCGFFLVKSSYSIRITKTHFYTQRVTVAAFNQEGLVNY